MRFSIMNTTGVEPACLSCLLRCTSRGTHAYAYSNKQALFKPKWWEGFQTADIS